MVRKYYYIWVAGNCQRKFCIIRPQELAGSRNMVYIFRYSISEEVPGGRMLKKDGNRIDG